MVVFVPEREGYGEHEDRGSRFLAYVFHAPEEEVFRARLVELKTEHPKAGHHCWAWRIGAAYRFNDDGEPGGTAGRPMMQVLEGSELQDVAAISVRYWGGTKLGTGGLARAYSASTARALEDAGRFEVVPRVRYSLSLPFPLLGLRTEIEALCSSCDFQGHFCEQGWVGFLEMEEQQWSTCQKLLDEKSGGRQLWELPADG
ncbi:MAG: thymidylate synthase [Planctomycetota bacterium]|nr:MAG: thymidylate synthase [Planctomycetota bacterium]